MDNARITAIVLGILGVLVVAALSLGLSLASLYYGWGLRPQSWPVIVGCAVLQIVLSGTMSALGKWASQ